MRTQKQLIEYYERLRRRGFSQLLALCWIRKYLEEIEKPKCLISRMQAVNGQGNASASVTGTFSLTTNGNFLIAAVATDLLTAITPPGGWLSAINKVDANEQVAIFYYENAPPTTTVQLIGGAANSWVLFLSEYTGVNVSGTIDQTATATGNLSTGNSGSTGTTPLTSQANELCVGVIGSKLVSDAETWSAPTNGFSIVQQLVPSGGNSCGVQVEYIVNAQSTYGTVVTVSNALTYTFAGCIATFKGSGSVAPGNRLAISQTFKNFLNILGLPTKIMKVSPYD